MEACADDGMLALAQAKRRASASTAAAKQAALIAGGHASEDEEAPLVRLRPVCMIAYSANC